MSFKRAWSSLASFAVVIALAVGSLRAQPAGGPGTATPPPAQAEAPAKDLLGRDTPKGTVIGFISASNKNATEVAPQYLNTRLVGVAAVDLAHKLFVVLDRRLPARLNALSDRPEGSLRNPLKPDEDIVGTITTDAGPLDIMLERISRGKEPPVWLFSRATLDAIPDVFDEIDVVSVDEYVPEPLVKTRIAGVRLFAWLVCLLIVPIGYRLIGRFNVVIGSVLALVRRPRTPDVIPNLLPGPLRLLLLAAGLRWLTSNIDIPLVERQFWSAAVTMLGIMAVVGLLLKLNAAGERYIWRRHLVGGSASEMATLVRVGRRIADVVAITAGVLVGLRYFGLDPTAALAGLGIGGIAVALAAQKTLENVIGGFSIFLDKAVRVGDFLKLGDNMGTVDHIGLRSTRIRTLDRTVLSVPNGQIANLNIETLSVRDKCWFHHFLALRYETTAAQMRAVVEGVKDMLEQHPAVETDQLRVRFLRLGGYSLDIEVSAYIRGSDWPRFLEIQEELLLGMMEIVEHSGTAIALPSQNLRLFDARHASIASSLH